MRNLIEFFLRYSSWMLFVAYMAAGCFMLFHSNPWQHHVMLTSANAVSAVVYKGASNSPPTSICATSTKTCSDVTRLWNSK